MTARGRLGKPFSEAGLPWGRETCPQGCDLRGFRLECLPPASGGAFAAALVTTSAVWATYTALGIGLRGGVLAGRPVAA